jgi:hypothetical protein
MISGYMSRTWLIYLPLAHLHASDVCPCIVVVLFALSELICRRSKIAIAKVRIMALEVSPRSNVECRHGNFWLNVWSKYLNFPKP